MNEEAPQEATVPLWQANVWAIGLVPIIFVVVLGLYGWLWGGLWFELSQLSGASVWWLLLLFFGSVVVHELLHAAGFIIVGRVPRTAVSYGINWKGLAPYAHCEAAMTASAYRTSVVLPLLILGIIPAIMGLTWGNFALTLWSTTMMAAAGGDIAVLWAIRHVPGAAVVRDHPSQAGCEVLNA